MRYISVCSGIEAATVAWKPLGWRAAAVAEIEPFPCRLLNHRLGASRPLYMPDPGEAETEEERRERAAAIRAISRIPLDGDIPNVGDFTRIRGDEYGSVDALAGGTPCQDFSIAGLRAGMDGKRGQLTVEFARLAHRLATRAGTRWLVWENVPGVLSIDGGGAFAKFLGILAGVTIRVPDGGWSNSGIIPGAAGGFGLAWRVLDAQFAGVPQRRRRVFVVGYFGDWRRAAAVLFERHSLSGHPPPRREAGKGFTHELAPSLTGSGRGVGRSGESRGQDPVVAVSSSTGPISHCLNGGGMGRQDFETETLLAVGGFFDDPAHSLRAEGFDASEDGTGRGTPLVPVAFRACGQDGFTPSEVCPPISATDGGGAGVPTGGQVAVAMNLRGREGGAMPEMDDVASLRAASGGSSRSYVAIEWSEELTASVELAGTVQRGGQGGRYEGVMTPTMSVRRLTPRECERLQGFPDDYTMISPSTPDGPRYKALGNSMAVPVMRWIGERIQIVDKL